MDTYLTRGMDYKDITTLGIALGLGLLVGLQREATNNKMAGVRTFTLITALGTMVAFLSRDFDNPFIFPAFALALAGLLFIGNLMKLKTRETPDLGQTTEVAALLMFAIGGYLVLGDRILAIVAGGILAILLYAKEHLHGFIDKLKTKELNAIMTFAGISLVILPVLPNETYGPLDVLNPYNIWLMVVLIVGISVIGYFVYKYVDQKTGIISNGILGGLISSTATTVSYARKTADSDKVSGMAAFVITVASAIALVRVIIEVGVIIPAKLGELVLPLLVEFVLMAAICAAMFYFIQSRQSVDKMPEPDNPAQFKSALIFGILYGLILLAVAFAKKEFGSGALYTVAVISGLTDVDAITLSLSQLMKKGNLETEMGWRLILLASLSNLMFKGVMAGVLGSRKLLKWVAISFGASIVAGLLLIWLWPPNWHF